MTDIQATEVQAQPFQVRARYSLAVSVQEFAEQAVDRMPEPSEDIAELSDHIAAVVGTPYGHVRKGFVRLRGYVPTHLRTVSGRKQGAQERDLTTARTVYDKETVLRDSARIAELLGRRLVFRLVMPVETVEPLTPSQSRIHAEDNISAVIRTIADPMLETAQHTQSRGQHQFGDLKDIANVLRLTKTAYAEDILIRMAESRDTKTRQEYYPANSLDPETGQRLPVSGGFWLLGRMAQTAVALGGELALELHPRADSEAV